MARNGADSQFSATGLRDLTPTLGPKNSAARGVTRLQEALWGVGCHEACPDGLALLRPQAYQPSDPRSTRLRLRTRVQEGSDPLLAIASPRRPRSRMSRCIMPKTILRVRLSSWGQAGACLGFTNITPGAAEHNCRHVRIRFPAAT